MDFANSAHWVPIVPPAHRTTFQPLSNVRLAEALPCGAKKTRCSRAGLHGGFPIETTTSTHLHTHAHAHTTTFEEPHAKSVSVRTAAAATRREEITTRADLMGPPAGSALL